MVQMSVFVLVNPKDGECPGYRLIRDPSEAMPGETIVEAEPASGEVWDEASGAFRQKGEAERLEEAKAHKVEEFARRGIDDLAPLFTPGIGRDETALLVAGHVLQICEALKIPPDPRLRTVVQTGEKALAKKAEVEAATTPEGVEGITWT